MLSESYFDQIVKPAEEDLFKQQFVITIRVDYDSIIKLDFIRDKYEWTRSQLVRFLLKRALFSIDVDAFDCLGLFTGTQK